MAQADKTYRNELQKQWGYLAAWPPTAEARDLGDYGEVRQSQDFVWLGNIRKWVIPKPSSRTTGSMYYVSSGVRVSKADFGVADVTKQASVDIKITFEKKSSIFFLAQHTTTVTMQNLAQVGNKIVDVYKQKGNDWKLGYVWNVEVVKADVLTVLIALQAGVSVTLSGKLPISYQGVPVANLDLRNFSVAKNAASVSFFHGSHAIPLFRSYRVKNPITKKAYYTEYK
jgi:hypothetical protein